MTFGELHFFIWRDRRGGLCLRRELSIGRLWVKYGSSPRDFEQPFRDSDLTNSTPSVLTQGNAGPLAEWGNLMSGVDNPREDGPGNLNWDMDPDHTGDNLVSCGAFHQVNETDVSKQNDVADSIDTESATSRGLFYRNEPFVEQYSRDVIARCWKRYSRKPGTFRERGSQPRTICTWR